MEIIAGIGLAFAIAGVVALAALVVYVGYLTAKALKDRLKGIINKNPGSSVVIASPKQVKEGIKKTKEGLSAGLKESTKGITPEDIDELFGPKGLLQAEMKPNGDINPDSIKILKATDMDDELTNILEKRNGLILTGKIR
jgi:hypothetical protein